MKTANNLFSGVAGKVFDRACAIVSECDQGKITLDDALDSVPSEYRRIVEHLLFCFFRYRKPVETVLGRFISRPPLPAVMIILSVAAVQCRFQSGIAPQSAVNVAVDAAKKISCRQICQCGFAEVYPNTFPG